jgi:hypothetical protein
MPRITRVSNPKEAVTVIISQSLPVELRIPKVVNTQSFKQNVRRILSKRGIVVSLIDSKRTEWKGILVMK